MKKLKTLLLGLSLLGLLAACGGTAETPAPEGEEEAAAEDTAQNVVIIGGQSDLKTLDPGNMYETYANMMSYGLYDMLYVVESNTLGTPEPSVATEYTVDETGTVYTFKLREDVVFASGNPLTAKDVVWSVNRVKNMPESNAYPNISIVETVEAPDDYTVVFTLGAADASFLVKLTSNAYCILDSELVKQHGGSDTGGDTAMTWLNENSAGSGPFILESWTDKQQLVMVKNPNYWGTQQNVDKIIFREMTSVDAQITALQNGEIDIAMGLDSETAKQLEGAAGITVATGPTALQTFLVMSRDTSMSPEMADPKVQEAVRYALDYEAYLNVAGEGAIVPLNFVQQGFSGGLERDLATEGRDLDRAKQLMQEAGYADGFTVTLTCGNNTSEGLAWTTIAQLVQKDLAEIGITVNIETLEATLVYDRMREGSMPFYVMFWSPDYYDINNQFAFLPNTADENTAYGDRTKWVEDESNAALWELADLIYGETDPELRADFSEQLQREYAKNNPLAFLLQHSKTFAYSSERLATVGYSDLCKVEVRTLSMN